MDDFKERMVVGYKELCDGINMLDAFIDEIAEDRSKVSDEHYSILRNHYFSMCACEDALKMRINDLGIDL